MLKVSLENGNYHDIRIKVEITYERLETLNKSGSGDLICESDLSSSTNFDLTSNGSGNVTIKGIIKAGQISIVRNGSGNMKLAGLQAETIKMNFSGSGNFDVSKVKKIEVHESGRINKKG